MPNKSASFEKSMRTIRRLIDKRNGKPVDKIANQVAAGSELISRNLYEASNSTESFGFLIQLCQSGLTDRAKNLLDVMVDLHPKSVASNPKLGDLFKSLIKDGHVEYVLSMVDGLTTGKIDQGPSLSPMSDELAANESVLSALKSVVGQEYGSRVALQVHRLAIMSGKLLSKNPKLANLLGALDENGFESEVALINSVRYKDPPTSFR